MVPDYDGQPSEIQQETRSVHRQRNDDHRRRAVTYIATRFLLQNWGVDEWHLKHI
jgi:hypothetical protein